MGTAMTGIGGAQKIYRERLEHYFLIMIHNVKCIEEVMIM